MCLRRHIFASDPRKQVGLNRRRMLGTAKSTLCNHGTVTIELKILLSPKVIAKITESINKQNKTNYRHKKEISLLLTQFRVHCSCLCVDNFPHFFFSCDEEGVEHTKTP